MPISFTFLLTQKFIYTLVSLLRGQMPIRESFVVEQKKKTNIESTSTMVAVQALPLHAPLFVRRRMENLYFAPNEITHASHTIYCRH